MTALTLFCRVSKGTLQAAYQRGISKVKSVFLSTGQDF